MRGWQGFTSALAWPAWAHHAKGQADLPFVEPRLERNLLANAALQAERDKLRKTIIDIVLATGACRSGALHES